ncbi:phosphopantetheine adenylyltransferase [Permianibacter aggregans]|uniref:Phosphopantetheine adenylyltransferase n=1 Tax=Permianibacter aggregans TaxID=1510150 RepID=A0A4R6US34_9GAMM|nr:phosphopantetheine adenylyltransferase [Permianibacter aggregans]QGX40745.1 phosphopantetheine adenylyltransferase [Permianibacter aggregans]TDQ48443.1 hypothetical protein EV696_107180 [Permianibacter aggregans]
MLERTIFVLLIAVGLVNVLPVVGVLSASILADAYGIAAPEGDLLILMRHRALLFGIVGGIILTAAFRRHLQPTAIIVGLVSMLGFIVLAVISNEFGTKIQNIVMVDTIASLTLVTVALLRIKKTIRN